MVSEAKNKLAPAMTIPRRNGVHSGRNKVAQAEKSIRLSIRLYNATGTTLPSAGVVSIRVQCPGKAQANDCDDDEKRQGRPGIKNRSFGSSRLPEGQRFDTEV
jgi:hypothetical protein